MLFLRKKVYDEYNDEEVELTKEEIDMIRRLRQGKIPHAEVNPYEVRNADQYCLCLPSLGKSICCLTRNLYGVLVEEYFVVHSVHGQYINRFTNPSYHLCCSRMLIGLSMKTKGILYQVLRSLSEGLSHQNGRRRRY